MKRFVIILTALLGGLVLAGIFASHTIASTPDLHAARHLAKPLRAANMARPCDPDVTQPNNAIYRICMPSGDDAPYNGQLVIWAHGYVNPNEPIHIPEDQLCPFGEDAPCIDEIANALGYGFATTSYPKNGLAIVEGIADIQLLIDYYIEQKGEPARIYLIGASEGGIITALMTEDYPDLLSAGLSMCGPIGDFNKQVNYFGDFRVLYNYFYPGNFPEQVIVPYPLYVYGMENFDELYQTKWLPSILEGGPSKMWELIQTAHIPYDPLNFNESIEQSIHDLFRYNVYAANDAAYTLGSRLYPLQPYHNMNRIYTGSLDNAALNAGIQRVQADPLARLTIEQDYQTSGELQIPLVTLHTTLDQQVPYWHEVLYQEKIDAAGSNDLYFHIRADRYEHCNFTVPEALIAFLKMLSMAGDDAPALAQISKLLPDAADQTELLRLAEAYGLALR
ncbi:MAG: hypothetical protein Fur0021_12570 [Candidatus Promineifilaceae bacterium]